MAEAKGEFNVTKWDEDTYAELESGKLTRAEIAADLSGDWPEAAGRVADVLSRGWNGRLRRLSERRRDARGSQRRIRGQYLDGAFDGKLASGPWTIVERSGRGGLTGISGAGSLRRAPRRHRRPIGSAYQLA